MENHSSLDDNKTDHFIKISCHKEYQFLEFQPNNNVKLSLNAFLKHFLQSLLNGLLHNKINRYLISKPPLALKLLAYKIYEVLPCTFWH